ncbi:capsid cement protein [Zhongshania sp.]|uniref:capsid cement protein n=1 Tax=Zhongshania sp. TaxID=1971902 RepID=UPI00356AE60F
MPDNIQISPPPYHDPDVNSQTWRNWFSQLRDQVNGVERVTTGGGSGGGGGSTTPDVDHTITTVRAQTQINAGQCVYVTGDNYVSRCSSGDLATRDVFGIALENATAGEEVEVATCGDATIPFASYTPGTVLYVGSDGYLTTTPPTTGYTKIVGTALRSNVVGMHWEPSIKLYVPEVSQAVRDYLLNLSPTALYLLNETSGTTAADSSGNGNDLSYVGSPTLGAAALISEGTSVSFDGVDDAVAGSSLGALSYPISMGGFVKFDDPVGASTQVVMSTNDHDTAYYGISLDVNVSGQLGTTVGDGGGFTSSDRRTTRSGIVLSGGVTYFIVAILRSATDVDLYVNNSKHPTGSSGSGGSVNYNFGELAIFRNDAISGTPPVFTGGEATHMFIFSGYEMTPTNISDIYNLSTA